MRTHVFLTPMSPDGKPGEVKEIVYNDEAPRQFVAPVSYFAEHDSHTRAELETERDALLAQLPKLKGGARSKADHRIRVLEREIRAAIDAEEAARRNAERQKERQRQQVGADSPFAKNTLTWDALRRDLAAKRAIMNETVCCEGRYLCATCRAKKAAAVA